MIEKLQAAFEKHFPSPSDKLQRYFFSPGRVNIIGEHIDYCGGNVLPAAIHKGTYAAVSTRHDDKIIMYSANMRSRKEVSIDDMEYRASNEWANYLIGVFYFLKKRGARLQGMNIYIDGDLPQGAGLSSSASVEMLAGVIVESLFDFPIDRVELIHVGNGVENRYIGVQSGIMDQFIIGMGRKDHLLLLHCDSAKYRYIKLPESNYCFLIINTNKSRKLEESQYNQRQRVCHAALRKIQTMFPKCKNLTDLDMDELASAFSILDDEEKKRSNHVVSENLRVKNAVRALQEADYFALGAIMYSSHFSLKNDFDVSCFELDTIVEASKSVRGVLGARMTGAGFGGCALALMEKDSVDAYKETVGRIYQRETGLDADFYSVDVSDGAGELKALAVS